MSQRAEEGKGLIQDKQSGDKRKIGVAGGWRVQW